MEVISKTIVASVEMSDVRMSEDEILMYEAALSHMLATLPSGEILSRSGATRDELEGIRDDLRAAVARHDESARGAVLIPGV